MLSTLSSSAADSCVTLYNVTTLDALDVRLLRLLRDCPRLPIAELARLADVARGTAQARLSRLENAGVVTGYGPDLDLEALGYGVLAFVTLQIAQGQDGSVVDGLQAIPEVLEAYAVTGTADLSCRVVARSNDHLHEVIRAILQIPGIQRTETQLALGSRLRRTPIDLVTG